MAFTPLSVPAFPDVPNVFGVPALLRKAQGVTDTIGYISHIDNVIERLTTPNTTEVWGIFDSTGTAALSPETFISLDFKNDARIMEYPVEDGAFETYNKVQNSFEASVVMAIGGTVSDRDSFLSAVDDLMGTLDLYTIVTPETTFDGVNLTGYSYTRQTSNGAHMIIVSLRFKEVRLSALVNAPVTGELNPDPAQLAVPDAAPPRSLGQVAAATISNVQTAAIAGAARALASAKAAASSFVTQTQTALDGITK